MISKDRRQQILATLAAEPQLTYDKVAARFGVSHAFVKKLYKAANPGVRKKGAQWPRRAKPYEPSLCVCGNVKNSSSKRCHKCYQASREELVAEALKAGKSHSQIVHEVGCSFSLISKVTKELTKKLGFVPRPKGFPLGLPRGEYTPEQRAKLSAAIKALHAKRHEQPDGYAFLRGLPGWSEERRRQQSERMKEWHRRMGHKIKLAPAVSGK